ncbi:MAG TPA: molybdopterin-synthase adenylyltransferase MoeB [Steroidobacteraceae bacterium]
MRDSTLSASERSRYQRHLALAEIGPAGQTRLKAARVLVVGAGGLGSPAAMYLAAAGVGTLGIVDCDRVELSNLQRQLLFATADVGRLKTHAACEHLARLNPEIALEAHALELRAANAREVLENYDVILDGTDRLATRYLINDACVMLGKPLVSAAIHRFEGQVMTYVPGRGACYRCLYPEALEGVVANCAEAGVLGVLPGVLGAIQATEAVKLVTAVGEPLSGRLLTYDALEMTFREFPVERRADCAVCSERPSITMLADQGERCGTSLERVRRLAAAELLETLRCGAGSRGASNDRASDDRAAAGGSSAGIVLVDVREPHEFAIGRLEGSINIPIGDLPRRLVEIPRGATPIFLCRSGRRSLAACELALRGGIEAPAHLEGGLLAWAREIDSTFALD